MIKRLLLFVFVLFISNNSWAQKEASIWFFGKKAGIDFSYSYPVPVTVSAMNVKEGCVTMCNSGGWLQFYTNGMQIWNKYHKIMPHAKTLKGHDSSSQSAIAIPNPANPNIIYLFTSDAGAYANPPNNGVSYYKIDMTKESGLGDVVGKDVLLLPSAAEKLTAVKHKNGKDIWVMAHGWNTGNFYCYLVTKDGVAKNAVISRIGSIYQGGISTDGNAIGYMKFSPDGKRLCSVIYENNFAELYDFNNETGELSNYKLIFTPQSKMAYGCEFSPNSKLLYLSFYVTNEIYQWDVTLTTTADIMQSAVLVAQSIDKKMGALQNALDGKIYVAKHSDYLGCIPNPNVKGIGCGYIEQALYLNGGEPQLGLPNYITSYFNRP